ncbi:MAG: MbcA/ParS/Xre antitoxin family protein [Lacunisphaera sp.]|nr:MbcA/ParS/Xre antitoxin family protein [Lacunisphaera sp.]
MTKKSARKTGAQGLRLLRAKATKVFEDKESARIWLQTPAYGLNGKIPEEYAKASAAGRREVERLLTRIDYGVYT